MNPEEQTELLIRIEERVKGICIKLDLMSNSRDMLITHDEKLKTHTRMIWGALSGVGTLAVGLTILALQIMFTGGKTTP